MIKKLQALFFAAALAFAAVAFIPAQSSASYPECYDQGCYGGNRMCGGFVDANGIFHKCHWEITCV